MIDMEPKCYYEESKKDCYKQKKRCVDLVLTILLVAFSFVIGIIIGACTKILVLLGLSVGIAVILGLLIVLRIVMLICRKKEKKCCK